MNGGGDMILAVDVGGTKLQFACFDVVDNRLVQGFHKRYASNQFSSLEEATDTFLKELHGEIPGNELEAACFGVAGPVVEGCCTLTNLAWEVNLDNLKKHFPIIKNITLCNDLEALGVAIPLLQQKNLLSLTPAVGLQPKKKDSRMAVLVPGTGLGEALILNGRIFSSEGGHCEFGPRNIKEAKLWRFLYDQLDHVSYERILSGEGLCRLVEFLMSERGMEKSGFPITPEEITKRAQSGNCELSMRAVELFSSILGAEAGNLALKALTLDGIYLGGNIVIEILPWLKTHYFMDAFLAKGRFSDLMETIPIHVILEKNTALHGCGLLAAWSAGYSVEKL